MPKFLSFENGNDPDIRCSGGIDCNTIAVLLTICGVKTQTVQVTILGPFGLRQRQQPYRQQDRYRPHTCDDVEYRGHV